MQVIVFLPCCEKKYFLLSQDRVQGGIIDIGLKLDIQYQMIDRENRVSAGQIVVFKIAANQV